MIQKPESRAKLAAKEAATNWGAVAVFVVFTAVMCFMAHSLKDGSELKTVIVSGLFAFAALFLGYFFTGQKQ